MLSHRQTDLTGLTLPTIYIRYSVIWTTVFWEECCLPQVFWPQVFCTQISTPYHISRLLKPCFFCSIGFLFVRLCFFSVSNLFVCLSLCFFFGFLSNFGSIVFCYFGSLLCLFRCCSCCLICALCVSICLFFGFQGFRLCFLLNCCRFLF